MSVASGHPTLPSAAAVGLSRCWFAWLLAVAVLVPRLGPAQEAAKIRVTDDRERKQLLIEIGPVDLPPHASHHGIAQPPAQAAALPVDGWIHGFDVELVDGRGRSVPRRMLHHVNLIVPEKRELFSQIMLRIGASGPETKAVRLPRLLGYRVHRGDTLLITAMLHNPSAQSYEGVRLRIWMPYTPSDTWLPPVSAYPFYVDVMPPAGVHAYDLPPGRSEQSWEGRPAISGRILGAGGHLHKYGVALRFEDVTTGEVVWEAKPTVDVDGNVIAMPQKRFFWRLGVPLHRDHVYRLTASYNNPTGRTIPQGAMGTLGGIILPDRSADWPAVDRRDPEYQLDVKVTYRQGGHGEHEHQGSWVGGQ